MAVDRAREERLWRNLSPKTKRGVLALKENANVRDGRIYDMEGNDQSHILEVNLKTTDKQIQALKAVDELTEHELENGGLFSPFLKVARRWPNVFRRYHSQTWRG